jgi:hypothetical protein
MAVRSKAWVCGRSPAGIVGSNSAGGGGGHGGVVFFQVGVSGRG